MRNLSATSRKMGGQLARGELRARHEIQQGAEAPGCRSTDEMQPGYGATETTAKFWIAVKLLNIPRKFSWKKIVSGYVHLITSSQQDMIDATFGAVVEFEGDLVPYTLGFRNGRGARHFYIRQARGKPARTCRPHRACSYLVTNP